MVSYQFFVPKLQYLNLKACASLYLQTIECLLFHIHRPPFLYKLLGILSSYCRLACVILFCLFLSVLLPNKKKIERYLSILQFIQSIDTHSVNFLLRILLQNFLWLFVFVLIFFTSHYHISGTSYEYCLNN